MNSKQLRIFIVFILISNFIFGQKWKYYRHEVTGSIGSTYFFGELGGADKIGTNYFIGDLDFYATRYVFAGGYSFKLAKNMAIKANIMYGTIAGDDQYTNQVYRRNRNLHFKTTLVEYSGQFEYYFIEEKAGHVFKLKGIKSNILSGIASYVFIGFGGLYYNPRAKLNDKWYDLRPLKTEGQGLPGATNQKSYSTTTKVIPYGIGVKYGITKQISLGSEIGGRITFSDYLDDVSTNYYDNSKIKNAYGDVAAYFADPSLGKNDPDYANQFTWTDPGEQRGDPKSLDAYVFWTFSLHYKFLKGKSIKPRF